MSNINIAQSVAGSVQELTQKDPLKNLDSSQSNIIDQQYNWLMKNNNDKRNEVINE